MICIIKKYKNKTADSLYFILSSLNMVTLLMCIILPSFANTLNMTRFYHITLIILAPLFVIGSLNFQQRFINIFTRYKNDKTYFALINIFIIILFLFQSGFVYEITNEDSYSIPLSKYRMGIRPYLDGSMITEYDAYGAEWLSNNIAISNKTIYSDLMSSRPLTSISLIYGETINQMTNITIVTSDGVIFLGWANLHMGKIVSNGIIYNTTDISPIYLDLNKIYTSGGCEIYNTN